MVHDALIAALEKVVKRDCILLTSRKCTPLVEYDKCASHFFLLTIMGATDTPYECYFTIYGNRSIGVNICSPRTGTAVLNFTTYDLFAEYWMTKVDIDLKLYCE